MSPEERDDELLQEYLGGDSALSRLYRRGAREKPDAQLDAKILAAARRPPSRKSSIAHSPFARHWVVPTSLAAMVVLSVSVLLLIPDPGGEPTLHMDDAAQQAPAQAPVSSAPASRAEQQPVPTRAPLSAQPGGRRDQTLEAETRSRDESASQIAPRQPAIGAQDADGERDKSESKRKAPVAPEKSLDAGAADALPKALRRALPQASNVGKVAEPAASDSARELLPSPLPRPAPPASVQDEPRAWLRFIEALLDNRDEPGARSNLRAFMNRYPDVPLPTRIAELAASLPTTPP